MPLLEAHWREVAHFDDIPLDPDRDGYAACESAGVIRCFTARLEYDSVEGKYPLVGYALYFVRPNPHYRSSIQAVQDVLYLAPSVRGGTGYRFVKFCDQQLAAEGVQVVFHHIKPNLDERLGFSRLLIKQGYEIIDHIYGKRLDTPELTDIQRDRPSAKEALDEAFI